MSDPRPPWTSYLTALLVAVLGVGAAVVVLVEAQARLDLVDERDSRQFVSRVVPPVVQALREQQAQAGVQRMPGARDVTATDASGPSPDVAALARDTGKPVLDDRNGGAVVTATYDPPGAATVAERRAGLVGFAMTPLTLADFVDVGDDGAIAIFGPSARVGASEEFDDVSAGAVRYDVALGQSIAVGWHVEVVSARSPMPLGVWLASAALLLAGLIGGLVTARRISRTHAERRAAERRAGADATLSSLATVAQSSLDLAEVLPASFAVMESHLSLDGITLLSTHARPTFVWRDAPGEAEDAVLPRAPVPAGACVDVPLGRTGRSLGVLRVRPREDLDELDVATLAAAAETLSSAMANADAYAHQRALITRMRALDDLKTVFVATASHELRTPVAAIIGYASMLNEGWDTLEPDQGKLYAQRVDSNAQRLAALVEHLLDFSRLEQHGADSGNEVVLDLGAEVQEVLDANIDLTPDHQLLAGWSRGYGLRLEVGDRAGPGQPGGQRRQVLAGRHAHPGPGRGRRCGSPDRRRRRTRRSRGGA